MKRLIRFWKKDFVNKLIVLVVLLITAALAFDLILLIKPKASGTSLLGDLFPTPTIDQKVILTQHAQTAVYQIAMATASVPPTMTTIPFTPMPRTATFTPTPVTPSPTAYIPPSTPQAALTQAGTGTPDLSQTPNPAPGLDCIPGATVQNGKAVDIVDGTTIKALIDGLVYTVRYLGIELPQDANFAGQAAALNGKLVFGKEISLIADGADKDQLGRLLRYVKVGEKFVNLELVQQGLATTENIDPLLSCADAFKKAEQSAREAKSGIWKIAPPP